MSGDIFFYCYKWETRKETSGCFSTAETSPNNNCQTPKRINSKGVKKKNRLKEQKDSVCRYKLKCLSTGLFLRKHYYLYNSTNDITLNTLSPILCLDLLNRQNVFKSSSLFLLMSTLQHPSPQVYRNTMNKLLPHREQDPEIEQALRKSETTAHLTND